MKLRIVAVGRLKPGPERDLIERYRDRLAPLGGHLGLGPLTIEEVSPSRKSAVRARLDEEGAALCARASPDTAVIAMTEGGKARASDAFARHLAATRDDGVADLAFMLGGADGLGAAVLERAGERMSLGPLTFPHMLARVVLAEQLYRAVTILAGHPYHRE